MFILFNVARILTKILSIFLLIIAIYLLFSILINNDIDDVKTFEIEEKSIFSLVCFY